jgi:hypothetical protein
VAKVPIPVGAAEVKPAVAAPAMPEKVAPAPPPRAEPPAAPATVVGVAPVLPVVGPIREIRLLGPAGELVVGEPGDYNLGRAKDAPLRVDNPTVSRKHARLVLTEDRAKAYIQDTGGANGTRLNGVQVERLVVLSDDDVIGIGDVELRVKLRRG